MKTEKEIKEEIENSKQTIKNLKRDYNNGKIKFENYKYLKHDCIATIEALEWVLGNNDRWD